MKPYEYDKQLEAVVVRFTGKRVVFTRFQEIIVATTRGHFIKRRQTQLYYIES